MIAPLSSSLILEFILRQPIEDVHLITTLISSLPIPIPHSYRLKKTLLLRSLLAHISPPVITLRTLETLELIEQLDWDNSVTPLPSLKSAYCAMAVACTLQHVSDGERFSDAVHSIWKCRVRDLEVSEAAVGLVGEKLREMAQEMEKAVDDPSLRERMTADAGGAEMKALEAVRVYLDDALMEMGPSRLEMKAGEVLRTDGRGKNGIVVPGVSGKAKEPLFQLEGRVDATENKGKQHLASEEAQRVSATIRDKGQSFSSVIPHLKENNSTSVSEFTQVKKAVQSSRAALQTVVEDPLSEAVALAAEVLCSMVDTQPRSKKLVENLNGEHGILPSHKPPEAGCTEGTGPRRSQIDDFPSSMLAKQSMTEDLASNLQDVCINDAPGTSKRVTDVDRTEGTATGCRDHVDPEVKDRPCLMDRNPTAHTYEWDDSIEDSYGTSPNAPKAVSLPSLKKRRLSPLNIPQASKFARRRTVKKWSITEENTLREGVVKYGKGNWKFILSCYRHIFDSRTEVDLKDKWRNMTRYNSLGGGRVPDGRCSPLHTSCNFYETRRCNITRDILIFLYFILLSNAGLF